MRTTEVRTIGDFHYTITQLGAKQGRLVLARVLRMVGAASEGDDPVAKLMSAITDEQVEYLCDVFAKSTMVAKAETPANQVPLADQFDNHFAGKYGDLLKWLWACLEVNFSSFLSDVGLSTEALKSAAGKMMAGNPASPTPQSGPSSSNKPGG